MSQNGPVVEMKALSKNYYKTRALDSVSLKIERGKIIGLLGPNGSGKSTMLKTIAGLVKPTAGEVLIEGRKPSVSTRERVSYLPELDYLYSWMTVKETLNFMAGFFKTWQEERAAGLLEFMDLKENVKVGNLSKGLRARLKLVISLARNVPLVLLDEPLSGIDPPSRTRILQSLVAQYRVGEQTIILSTHEVKESEPVFEEAIFLYRGTVKLFDSVENLRVRYGCSLQDMWEEVYAE